MRFSRSECRPYAFLSESRNEEGNRSVLRIPHEPDGREKMIDERHVHRTIRGGGRDGEEGEGEGEGGGVGEKVEKGERREGGGRGGGDARAKERVEGERGGEKEKEKSEEERGGKNGKRGIEEGEEAKGTESNVEFHSGKSISCSTILSEQHAQHIILRYHAAN